MVLSRLRSVTVGVVALAVLSSGLRVPAAEAADPGARKPDPVSAEDSVVTVPARPVGRQLAPGTAGTRRPQATATKVTWPTAGSARIKVPASDAPTRAGSTAVSVTRAASTRAASPGPDDVAVTAYDRPRPPGPGRGRYW
jgi:hypothetical protein